MATKQITVLAATDQESLEFQGADVEDSYCQTIAEAKRRAKYYLTEEYHVASETSTRLAYAQVLVNGKCIADFFTPLQKDTNK